MTGLDLPIGNHTIALRALAAGGSVFRDSGQASLLLNVEPVAVPISTPHLFIDGKNVFWPAMQGAASFAIHVNGVQRQIVAGNEFNLLNLIPALNPGGTYEISLMALPNFDCPFHLPSALSNRVTITMPQLGNGQDPIDPTPLSAPTGLTINGTTISWNGVMNSNGYSVIVPGHGAVLVEAGTSLNMATLTANLQVGVHGVVVHALGDGQTFAISPASQSVNFEIFRLGRPENVRVTSGRNLSWNNVPNAAGYNIYIGGVLRETVPAGIANLGARRGLIALSGSGTMQFDLGGLSLPHGSTNVALRAVAANGTEFRDSVQSLTYDFYVPQQTTGPDQLTQPLGLTINGTVLSWGAVANSSGYQLNISGRTVHVPAGTSLDFDALEPPLTNDTNYSITVTALGDGVDFANSIASNSVNFMFQRLATPIVTVERQNFIRNNANDPLNGRHTHYIRWDSIPNAANYEIIVNGNLIATVPAGTTVLDLANMGLTNTNGQTVIVRALAENGTVFRNSEQSVVREINVLPNDIVHFLHRFGRDCLLEDARLPGDTRPERVRFDRGVHNAPAEHVTSTWGRWVEAMIAEYIRDMETAFLNAQPIPPITAPGQGSAMNTTSRWFPRVLNQSWFIGQGVLSASGIDVYQGGIDNRRFNNMNHWAGDARAENILPGFNVNDRYRDDGSFAPAKTIASAVIIHEEFYRAGGRAAQMHQKVCEAFPMIPPAVIQRAIDFHLRTLLNMHQDIYFHITPPMPPATEYIAGYAHNVFDFFNEFGISNRITNHSYDIFNIDNTTPDNVAFGMGFSETGFPRQRLGRCAHRLGREAERGLGLND